MRNKFEEELFLNAVNIAEWVMFSIAGKYVKPALAQGD